MTRETTKYLPQSPLPIEEVLQHLLDQSVNPMDEYGLVSVKDIDWDRVPLNLAVHAEEYIEELNLNEKESAWEDAHEAYFEGRW